MYTPFEQNSLNNGTQDLYKFSNGYGASVICHDFSYGGEEGLKELAVIKFDKENPELWGLCYTTHVTDDVIGYLTDEAVEKLLTEIANLEGDN